MKYSFVFICQQGQLELQAMLLAASLRRNSGMQHQLVAAIPTPESRWGRPSDETLQFLKQLDVDILPITNQIDEAYPIGNKVSCLLLDLDGDFTIFIDTDMMCLQSFSHFSEFDAPFCAKPTDFYTFRDHNEDNQLWEKVYGSFGLPMPRATVKATVSGESMPPYFNSGFVAVRRGTALGEAWLDACRRIDANDEIINKRPWLDQIGLPVAVARLGLEFRCLDERFNFPCHARSVDPRHPPTFAHYHWPRVLLGDPVLREYCQDLAREHGALADALRRHPAWRRLLYPSPVADAWAVRRMKLSRVARATRRSVKRLWLKRPRGKSS